MQHHSRDSPKINKISLEKNLCTLLTCITLTTDHKGPQHTRHWSEISPFSQVPCISQLHPVKKSINEYCKDVSSPVIQMQHILNANFHASIITTLKHSQTLISHVKNLPKYLDFQGIEVEYTRRNRTSALFAYPWHRRYKCSRYQNLI